MAMLPANSDIGPNSLKMLSQDVQDAGDYMTGEVLAAGIVGRTQYQCLANPSAAQFQELGTFIQQEVTQELSNRSALLVTTPAALQSTLSDLAGQGAVITDEDLANAPTAVPLGAGSSTGNPLAAPIYTDTQIAAAGNQPIDWAQTLTLQPSNQLARIKQQHRRNLQAGSIRPASQIMPGVPWDVVPAARPGYCCGLSANPLGKMFLFTGLGLIAAAMLRKKGR